MGGGRYYRRSTRCRLSPSLRSSLPGSALGLTSKFVLVLLVAVFPGNRHNGGGPSRQPTRNLIEAAPVLQCDVASDIHHRDLFPMRCPFIVSGRPGGMGPAHWSASSWPEFFGSFAGFGFAVMAAGQTFDTATLLTYVIVLGAMGLVGSMVFQSLETRLCALEECMNAPILQIRDVAKSFKRPQPDRHRPR